MNATIYKIVNNLTGDSYIGLTTQPLDKRWKQHISKSFTAPKTYLHRAIHKYGREAFNNVEFACAVTIGDLAKLEQQIIMQEQPQYNQTHGGEVTLGRKYTDEVLRIIKAKNTGKKRTPEQCRRISESKKQQYEENPQLRKASAEVLTKLRLKVDEQKRIKAVSRSAKERVWSNESRQKLSASVMGRRYSDEIIAKMAQSKKKPIVCITNGVTYSCALDASESTKISLRSIHRVCNGQYESVKGYKFKYL